MWCPKCRYEYREGITVCPDCGTPLVESLEEYDREQTRIVAEKEAAELARAQAAQAADYSADDLEEEDSPADGFDEDTVGKAMRQGEEGTDAENGEDADDQEENASPLTAHSHHYVDSAEHAEDNRSSAQALLGVGTIGLVFIILAFLNVFPFLHLSGLSRYFICGIMGAMFFLFIVMGFVSLRSSRTWKEKVVSEHSIEDKIRTWCGDNLKADEIDLEATAALDADLSAGRSGFHRVLEDESVGAKDMGDVSEDSFTSIEIPEADGGNNAGGRAADEDTVREIKKNLRKADYEAAMYFARTEVIRKKISSQFVGLEDDFLDHIVEEYYPLLYGSDDASDNVVDEAFKDKDTDADEDNL